MSGADWSLRLARAEDAAALPGIERAAAVAFAGEPSVDPLRTRSEADYARLIRRGHCLVAHVGERPAGFLAAEPFGRELHIWEMDVLPAFQRRGIGAGLVRAAQIDARNTGFRALTLTTFRDLAWNGPFYERLGFEEVTALDAHPRLAGELANEVDDGMPADRRCAMIRFLD
ncbi:MAG: GNAT family N-acetyltransferase [Porphyrobacter sp.]|nr:GNAT family N-acetyltransferase [Porphyrobacter sp.]